VKISMSLQADSLKETIYIGKGDTWMSLNSNIVIYIIVVYMQMH
jgi:hypothetical protein